MTQRDNLSERTDHASSPRNRPLPFASLRGLDPNHHYLTQVLKLKRCTMEHFGVGFCRRGMMHGRVAIPIHGENGRLVAYCGRAIGSRQAIADQYPSDFHKGYEIYNVHRARETVGARLDGLVVTGDFTHVWRLFECGWTNVIALLEPSISLEQLLLIDSTVGADQRLTLFFDWESTGFVQTLFALQGAFYVRVCRPPQDTRIVDLCYAQIRKVLANGG